MLSLQSLVVKKRLLQDDEEAFSNSCFVSARNKVRKGLTLSKTDTKLGVDAISSVNREY